MNCATCNTEIDPLEMFPNGNCVNCHEAIFDKVPLSELEKPDFTKTIN